MLWEETVKRGVARRNEFYLNGVRQGGDLTNGSGIKTTSISSRSIINWARLSAALRECLRLIWKHLRGRRFADIVRIEWRVYSEEMYARYLATALARAGQALEPTWWFFKQFAHLKSLGAEGQEEVSWFCEHFPQTKVADFQKMMDGYDHTFGILSSAVLLFLGQTRQPHE